MAGKGVVRSLKNFTKGFSDIQIKVREATSNDAWGPSGTLMNEMAQMTYNQQDFIEVMDMIDKRLNDKGKNWKHVFKALLLLDYCLHVGSENVVLYAKENAYVVKTLKEFQHVEENGKDVGANVRQKAKDIANLLQDDNRLREERRQRQQMRDRMAGVGDYMGEMAGVKEDGAPNRDGSNGNSDLELMKVMEESKRQAAKEEQKRRQGEDHDLAIALQLSEQEAREKAKTQQPSANADFDALFSSYPQQQQQQQQAPLQIAWTPEPTSNGNSNSQFFDNSMNNGTYQPANNPYLQQQQQQQQSFQQFQHPQVTGIPGSFGNIQPQQQQQPQQPFGSAMFTDTTQHQSLQSSFGQPGFADSTQQHQQLTPFSAAPFQTAMPTGSRNPFSQQQQQQPTSQGSQVFTAFAQQQQQPSPEPPTPSSPFAFGQNSPAPSSPFNSYQSTSPSTDNASSSLHAFNSSTLSTPSSPSTAGQSRPFTAKTNDDPRYEKLNSLLGSKGDGMDTFGNTGSLRVPFGTGFANTIKPQENGELAKAGNTKDGFDAAFGLLSPGLINTDQQQQQQNPSRNPFGTNENTYTSPPSNPLLSAQSSPFYT